MPGGTGCESRQIEVDVCIRHASLMDLLSKNGRSVSSVTVTLPRDRFQMSDRRAWVRNTRHVQLALRSSLGQKRRRKLLDGVLWVHRNHCLQSRMWFKSNLKLQYIGLFMNCPLALSEGHSKVVPTDVTLRFLRLPPCRNQKK